MIIKWWLFNQSLCDALWIEEVHSEELQEASSSAQVQLRGTWIASLVSDDGRH